MLTALYSIESKESVGIMTRMKVILICLLLTLAFGISLLVGCAEQTSEGVMTNELNPIDQNANNEAAWKMTRKVERDHSNAESLYSTYEYIYSEDGKSVTEVKALSDNEIGDPSNIGHTELTKTYDDAGNVVYESETEIDDSGSVVKTTETSREFFMPDKPSYEEVIVTTPSKTMLSTTYCNYDDKGNLLEKDFSQKEGSIALQEYVIICDLEYDTSGNLVSDTQQRSDTGEQSISTKEYDGLNRLIKDQTIRNKNGFNVETTYKYNYDDRNNSTYEYFLNLYDGEIQSEYTYNYLNLYDEDDRVLCRVLEGKNGDGYYFEYDESGRMIENIHVVNGMIISNEVNVYDSNGLLLMTFSQPDLHTNNYLYNKITTYEYENAFTKEKVSGDVYNKSKYYSSYSVDHPSPSTTLIDYPSLYRQASGDSFDIEDLDFETAKKQLLFDAAANTDPAQTEQAEFDQPMKIDTGYYSFELPDYWQGKVAYNVVDSNVCVYLAGYASVPILTVDFTDGIEAGNAYFFSFNEELANGEILNFSFPCWDLAYAQFEGEIDSLLSSVSYSQRMAVVESLVDITSGGSVSLDQVQIILANIDSERDIPSFEYIRSSIVPTIQ